MYKNRKERVECIVINIKAQTVSRNYNPMKEYNMRI